MVDKEYEKLLDDFSKGETSIQHGAFRKIIALRKQHMAVKDSRFKSGIDRLCNIGGAPSANDIDRLLAIATLGRIASTIRSIKEKIYESLAEALKPGLPDPHSLSDPDDRTYIGNICGVLLPDWARDYSSKAAVFEESAEQARQSFLVTLLRATPNLEEAIGYLMPHLEGWVPETEEPGDSVSRRLRRILAALKGAISDSLPEPGENVGATLSKLIRSSYSGVPTPADNKALTDTAEEVAGVVHELVRLRFSLATDPSTYSALREMKALIPVDLWKMSVEKSKIMSFVLLDITEAMLILARQGVTDSSLLEQLVTAAGSREIALKHMKEIAQKTGISKDIREWLIKGRHGTKVVDHSIGESQRLSEDAQIADLLVDSIKFRHADNIGRDQILPEIEILNPALGNELKRLLNYGLGLCDAIGSVAKRKGMRVRGAIGEEEEYIPLEHEMICNSAGIRRVRIIRPVVEQLREDGIAFVLRKGLVEPVKI